MKDTHRLTNVRTLRIRFALMFVSLAVALTALAYVTYSWFIFNRRAEIGGLNVGVDDNFDVTYSLYQNDVLDDDQFIDFSLFYPGIANRKKLTIVTNNFGDDVSITWGFKVPTANQELPFIDEDGLYGPEDHYYYLGSQIQVSEVNVSINSTPVVATTASGSYLVPTSSGSLTKGQENSVATEILNFPRIDLISNLTIGYYQSATIDIFFTFVDNGTNQNVFKDAWPLVGTSSRQLFLYLKEA